MKLPDHLNQFLPILMDSYFIVDKELNIVDFNQALYLMLPRPLARNLRRKKCYEVLELDICAGGCIAQECWAERAPICLNEISGRVAGTDQQLIFILSAIPLIGPSPDPEGNPDGEIIGALVTHRNVTDEAIVQVKYQQQLEAAASDQTRINSELERRTRRVFELSRQIHELQQEALRYKAF